MRVLHVSRFFHPHVGGTENFIASLMRELIDVGHECQVLVTDRHAARREDAAVRAVRAIGPDSFPKPFDNPRKITDAFAWADVIHVHDVRFLLETATLFQALRGTPVVLSTHGLIFHTRRRAVLKRLLWRAYYSRLLGSVRTVICDSRHDLRRCREIGLASNLVLVPNPVDTSRFVRDRSRAPAEGSLLYFGRLEENKGIDRLHGLLRTSASSSLTIVGTGNPRYVGQLTRAFADVSGRVRFAGFVDDEELLDEIDAHACIVLPSRAEGFGLTVVEALATGVPVVASDIPTFREIEAGTGLPVLTDFGDPATAREAIQRAVNEWDADLAVERARQFDWATAVGRYVDVYEEAVA